MEERKIHLWFYGVALLVGGLLLFSPQSADASTQHNESVRISGAEGVTNSRQDGSTYNKAVTAKSSKPNLSPQKPAKTNEKTKVMSQKELNKTLKRIKAPSKKDVQAILQKKVGKKGTKGLKTVYVLTKKKGKSSKDSSKATNKKPATTSKKDTTSVGENKGNADNKSKTDNTSDQVDNGNTLTSSQNSTTSQGSSSTSTNTTGNATSTNSDNSQQSADSLNQQLDKDAKSANTRLQPWYTGTAAASNVGQLLYYLTGSVSNVVGQGTAIVSTLANVITAIRNLL